MFIKELKQELLNLGVNIHQAYNSPKVSGDLPKQQFTCGKDVPAIELAHKIRNFAYSVQFVQMMLPPSGFEYACLYRIENIFVRYLEAYEPNTDKLIGRYDVIIIKCD